MPYVASIGSSAFYGCTSLASVEMPSATFIDEYAFCYCTSLASVEMPSVTSIGDKAFYDCTSLASVEMPSAMFIDEYAFYDCTSLASVDIPCSVLFIGDAAFGRCTSLREASCHWDEPLVCYPEFADEVLDSAILYIPTGTKSLYALTKPWNGFKNIVEKNYSSITSTQSSAPTVTVIDGAIVIEDSDSGAAQPVEVYSTGGECVHRGTGTRIGGLTHGVYVVRVGQSATKVVL